MALEVEDDAFFADLSRQIALLITDDEEEFPAPCPPLPVQGFPPVPQVITPPPFAYEMSYRRESKGTGVFIPRSSLPRRKLPRPARPNSTTSSNSHNKQQQQQQQHDKLGASSNNRVYSSDHYSCSAMLKRHS